MFSFEDEVERKRLKAVERIKNVPVSALIWGPSPTAGSVIADTRIQLKDALNSRGHLARFSEELFDPGIDLSVLAQQVTHAEAFDVIFSLPDSAGSIAEIHDFARIPFVSQKIVAFIDNRWNAGYSNLTLMQLESNSTCKTQGYNHADLPDCIINSALSLVSRLQEFYYLSGRRF